MRPLRDMSLTTKFFLGTGLIFLFFWCLFNVLIYFNLKDTTINQTYEKTDILFSHIQATVQYIRKKVRPKLFHILPENSFIPEAMSVSFMNKEIMAEFKKHFPDFIYRRVAYNPMNPANTPNEMEKGYIELFRRGERDSIREVVKKDGHSLFIHARPIVIEKECLSCHGKPEEAPVNLVSLYGTSGGYNRKEGEIIGVESIAIPVDQTFLQIKGLVFSIFLTGIVGVVLLFFSVNYYISVVAVRPIKSVSRFFKSVVSGEKDLDTRVEVKSKDEIGDLATSFNQMMAYLKDSQEKLKSSETKYRRIFEGSKDSIIIADCDGFIIDLNPAGLELLGCEDKDRFLRKKTFPELFVDQRDYVKFLRMMESDGYVKDFEAVLIDNNGRRLDTLITANFRSDKTGNVCGYEAIIKDITEWKRMQEKLQEADRLASVGQLAAGLAHELNSPLGIILGFTSLLEKEVAEGEDLKRDIQVIRRNAEICKRIVEDLLKFSRRTETNPEHVNINQIVDEVLEMLSYAAEEKGVRFEWDLDQTLPDVIVDREKIRQVVMNITLNALQAVEKGGEVIVKTGMDRKGGRVFVSVKDNGSGIPRENLKRIFEPFFTTKEPGEGTGLGLSVSYGIVKEHGGEIIVESTYGEGSIFTVYLPVEKEAQNA